MDQFKFEAHLDVLNDRAVFANRIFKLLWQKHGGNIDEAIEEAEPFFNDLERYVRNIYEIKDTEIPLWSYAYLLENEADNWGYEQLM